MEKMNSKENVLQILENIKYKLKSDKKKIQKAFELDNKTYGFKIDFVKLISCIDTTLKKEFLPKTNKSEIIDGIGKIALIVKNQNPYQIFNFIINAIYTNNCVTIFLTDTLLASNKSIITSIKSISNVDYIEVSDYYDFVKYQDSFDSLYYYGIKEEYMSLSKRIHIDSRFESFGNLAVFSDSDNFKGKLLEIDKFAYKENFQIDYFSNDLAKALKEINTLNDTTKIALIYTLDIEKAYEFIKQIKSKKVYINQDISNIDFYEIDESKLVYSKKIKL